MTGVMPPLPLSLKTPPTDGAAPSAVRRIGPALRPWLILALVSGGFSLHPAFLRIFWTRDYLPTLLQQAGTNIILAVGMTFVILTGGIDLSVGSVMALCGVGLGLSLTTGPPAFMAFGMAAPVGILAAYVAGRRMTGGSGRVKAGLTLIIMIGATLITGTLLGRGMTGGAPLPLALSATLLLGVGCGLFNGLIVAVGRVPSFVVTLGMLTAARSLAVYATDGNSVSGLPLALGRLGQGIALVLIALAVVAGGVVLQRFTRSGRYMIALGANETATWLTGVNVTFHKTVAYALSGLCAAVAAIVLTAKFQLADTGAGTGAELNAIAAVVIGGTSLSGGRGSVLGSLVGALTIAVLNSGLVLVGVKDTLQGVIIGAVIVLAVIVDGYRRS